MDKNQKDFAHSQSELSQNKDHYEPPQLEVITLKCRAVFADSCDVDEGTGQFLCGPS